MCVCVCVCARSCMHIGAETEFLDKVVTAEYSDELEFRAQQFLRYLLTHKHIRFLHEVQR